MDTMGNFIIFCCIFALGFLALILAYIKDICKFIYLLSKALYKRARQKIREARYYRACRTVAKLESIVGFEDEY